MTGSHQRKSAPESRPEDANSIRWPRPANNDTPAYYDEAADNDFWSRDMRIITVLAVLALAGIVVESMPVGPALMTCAVAIPAFIGIVWLAGRLRRRSA